MEEIFIVLPVAGARAKITCDSSAANLIKSNLGYLIDNNIRDTYKNIYVQRACKNILKVFSDDDHIFELDDDETLDYIIESLSCPISLPENEGYVYYHGSSIANNHKEVMFFIAPTMQGKTTVVTMLHMHGYTYLSDDLIPVDENLNVYAYPLPIKFRNNTSLEELDFASYFNVYIKANNYLVLSPKTINIDFQERLKPGKIIFLGRTQESKRFTVEKLNPISALDLLIKNAAIGSNWIQHIKISKLLAEQIPCYQVEYNQWEQILNWLGSGETL